MEATIAEHEFKQFQSLLYDIAGISLSAQKKPLVCGRLAKRLKAHQLDSFGDYLRLLKNGAQPDELQIAIDLLTTNETYFFREPKHFEFLAAKVLPAWRPGRPFRVWSAACSSGEEPYSLAMLLAERLGDSAWEIIASDLSTRVLEKAGSSHYPMERAKDIPRPYLLKYCLKGVGAQDGTFLIDPGLRKRVSFVQINLTKRLPEHGEFDVIFLRNVMIYFDQKVKQETVARLLPRLRPGGHFMIGHSETLNGISSALQPLAPAIYRKP